MLFLALLNSIKIALPVVAVLVLSSVVTLLIYYFSIRRYKSGTYYQMTQTSFTEMENDAGKHGEYAIYSNLCEYESEQFRFLFNLYIPKRDGTTTEIDSVVICPKGIFVFESKNWGGWIFGDERQKDWHQTLPGPGGKSINNTFYNPILQNRGHIANLKRIPGMDVAMFSFVVFSDRCTLKNVTWSDPDVIVTRYEDLASAVDRVLDRSDEHLDQKQIAWIYNTLYPYTQTDERTKQDHINSILNK